MVLLQVCFEFPVEAIAVNGEASSFSRIGAVGNWAAVYKVGVGSHIVVSAVPAILSYEGGNIMTLFKGHVIPSGPHCELQGYICR